MNYDKYKQEERDFIRYWNQHDVVKEEKTIETQTKHLKRVFGLHLFASYFRNAPYNTRYRRNKDTFIFHNKYVITSKDRKLINRLFEEASEDSLHFTSKYKKTRTLRLAEMVQEYIWEYDRISDEEEKFHMKMAECISSDEDKVFVDTEYSYAVNRKMAEDLKESLTIPSGTIIEICKKSTPFDIPPSMLKWDNDRNTGSGHLRIPFKEDCFINGKMEKMKSISVLLLHSLKHLLPYRCHYEFAPEGVIFDLKFELTAIGANCKLFVPYDRLRTTIPQLCDIKWSLVSWFRFIVSFQTYDQHYLLVSNEAKRYFDVA